LKILGVCLCAVFLICAAPSDGFSEVIVHDLITPQAQKVMLKAETRGKLFHKGGELVEFFVDGQPVGRVLSGGDGFAFRQFTPKKSGTYRITAKSGADEAHGILLSLKKGTGIVFVDIEGSLFREPFSEKTRDGSQKAIKAINRRFPVVFLHSGIVGTKKLRAWLKENGFPALPVVPWDQGKIFDELHETGFRIKAVIGRPEIIEPAKEYHPDAFTFQEAEGAREVKDWKEIEDTLVRR
jgi:hypothetical protein